MLEEDRRWREYARGHADQIVRKYHLRGEEADDVRGDAALVLVEAVAGAASQQWVWRAVKQRFANWRRRFYEERRRDRKRQASTRSMTKADGSDRDYAGPPHEFETDLVGDLGLPHSDTVRRVLAFGIEGAFESDADRGLWYRHQRPEVLAYLEGTNDDDE